MLLQFLWAVFCPIFIEKSCSFAAYYGSPIFHFSCYCFSLFFVFGDSLLNGSSNFCFWENWVVSERLVMLVDSDPQSLVDRDHTCCIYI
ncbi:hypothetical protein VNO78_02584 [Psophocarpus tetragonolobus]|uniref:Uncharacterized protein n=1 Tax=Psophocarpus tetragonolobus TaxID=3891 RepID=A0AAN9XVR4_PSOTE